MSRIGEYYANRLASLRENQNEMQEELRENYDEDLKDIEETYEGKLARQKNTFLENRDEMEKDHDTQIQYFTKKTQSAIKDRRDDYLDRLTEQREDFMDQRQKLEGNFDRRIADISNAYNKAAKSNEEYANQLRANEKNRYNDQLNRVQEEADQRVEDIANNATRAQNELRDEYKTERQGMIKDFQDEKNDLARKARVASGKASTAHQYEMDELRKVADERVEELEQHHTALRNEYGTRKEEELDSLKGSFDETLNEINQNNTREQKNTARLMSKTLKEREDRFQKDLQFLKKKTREVIGSGSDRNTQEQVKLKNQALGFEKRIGVLKNQFESDRANLQLEQERLDDKNRSNVKAIKDLHNHNVKMMANDNAKERSKILDDFRVDKDTLVNQYEDRLSSQKFDLENRIKNERLQARKELTSQKEILGRTISALEIKTQDAIETMKSDHAQEKSSLLKDARIATHAEKEEVREELLSRLERTEKSYQQRVEQAMDELDKVTDAYESRIDVMNKKFIKELDLQKEILDFQREEDAKSFEKEIADRDAIFRKDYQSQKTRYDMQIEEIKHANDIQVNKLVQRYEDMLERERIDHERELKQKVKSLEESYERLSESSEIELDAIRDQYELKIDKINMAHRAELERYS